MRVSLNCIVRLVGAIHVLLLVVCCFDDIDRRRIAKELFFSTASLQNNERTRQGETQGPERRTDPRAPSLPILPVPPAPNAPSPEECPGPGRQSPPLASSHHCCCCLLLALLLLGQLLLVELQLLALQDVAVGTAALARAGGDAG